MVVEALKERQTVKELAQKFGITPQQINTWKRDFLKEADTIFSKGEKSKKSEEEEKKDQLLKVIGELKVENDFLPAVRQV